MWLVGFASVHQKALWDFLEKRGGVNIRNCKKSPTVIRKKKVFIKGATKIFPSSREFNVSEVDFQATESTVITLRELPNINLLTIITVDVNVVSCDKMTTLSTRQKQEVKVCDATGWAIVQLWEQNIRILQEGCSYKLSHFRIVEYECKKYIAMC